MKTIILFTFFAIISIGLSESNYSTYISEKGQKIIIGNINTYEWISETSNDFTLHNVYIIDSNTCYQLKEKINSSDIRLIFVGGSWCGDTKSEFPKLFKILDVLNLSKEKFEIFGVDRDKKLTSKKYSELKIELVPTVVVLKHGVEIGRIEEYPESSWEKDLMIILGD